MKGLDPFLFEGLEYEVITTNKKKQYINLECAFDIETTSTYLADGTKIAFMYIWTFGIRGEEYIFHGRTWSDFHEVCVFLQDFFNLSETRILTCYVHNLSFEFQFMRKYFTWLDVFSISDRKPIKALCSYGIEFKDSYILSGFALSRLAKNLQNHQVEKLEGDLDYELIRHSKTEMTNEEMKYCVNDVLIILYYINEQIIMYGDITKIPLTNTGRVRAYVKHECYYTNKNHRKSSGGKFQRYRKIMNDLQINEPDYIQLKRAFMGGFTHANAKKSGNIINDVTSIDFTSSYPAVMLSERFPMSSPIPTTLTKEKDLLYYRERFCLVLDVKFTNMTSKIQYENYISESKCVTLSNPIINNGRIFSADELTMTITDIDLEIIENCYTWEKLEVANINRFHRGYLPKDIIKSVIKLYADKTTLKDVQGKEVEYNISKGMLNSTYGMCVTDIIRDEISYDDDWGSEIANATEQLEKHNKSYSRFLYYPWGVWITAYSRLNLWTGILHMGDDYIYSDTDSIKFENHEKHKPYINAYNNQIINKLKKMCEFYKLDYNDLEPETIEGVKKPIGVWDLDGKYKRFKTLGAKRYLVEYENNEMELTCAGLSKTNGLEYMKRITKNNTGVFKMFNDELHIPDSETGKMTHTYIDTLEEFTILDYAGVESNVSVESGCHLEKCDFTLSITSQYIEFMKNLLKGYLYVGMENV